MAKPQAAGASAECKPTSPTRRLRDRFRVSKPNATHARRHKYQGHHPAHPRQSMSEVQPIDNSMEDDTIAKIDKILAKTNSIDDLDLDTVAELRGTLAGRFSIEKFSVDLWDWKAWSEKHQDIRGIEYDAQNSHIQIKATGSPLHEAATGVIGEWLQGLRDHLTQATGNKFVCIRSAGVHLSSDYDGSEKAPDEGLRQIGERYPLVAVEIAVSETSKKVFEDATRWLKGSNGYTKLVIVVDIKEKISKDGTAETTDWGLSKDILNTLNSDNLTEHILQWHKDNKAVLVGRFEASFFLCFQNQHPRQVWKCEFSLDELERKCFILEGPAYITTKDLIPGLDESNCFPLPLQDLSTRMRDCLIDHELRRASAKARDKLKEIGKIPDKKKSRA
ncbi:hypothetical protein LOZ61_005776 [Ophidiomyces ophidiicola]|nr:hypothetical protein LOZ61_005776 [Ophidiomyces ophidiicola]KAI1926714.1 hypothetical protein LOZ60_003529 [Ophidiomyces ophidiicola]KAI1968017.1 hypothetical protein LOZ59_000378 [Ophidiomyces ophidiicola]KAI1975681.1 hypothetical protein LOZ56_000589 [Ophidiomyces ophidiicola]KAI2004412.1 hypothetical protein LOZ49_005868 [Ophidiomyces ophidiicola]